MPTNEEALLGCFDHFGPLIYLGPHLENCILHKHEKFWLQCGKLREIYIFVSQWLFACFTNFHIYIYTYIWWKYVWKDCIINKFPMRTEKHKIKQILIKSVKLTFIPGVQWTTLSKWIIHFFKSSETFENWWKTA